MGRYVAIAGRGFGAARSLRHGCSVALVRSTATEADHPPGRPKLGRALFQGACRHLVRQHAARHCGLRVDTYSRARCPARAGRKRRMFRAANGKQSRPRNRSLCAGHALWRVKGGGGGHRPFVPQFIRTPAVDRLSIQPRKPDTPRHVRVRQGSLGPPPVALGRRGRIALGDLGVVRDWGWAPDYAEAMLRMSELEQPTELILATGRSVSLRTAIASLVCAAGLEWHEAIAAPDARLSHHTASDEQHADPSRAMNTIGWTGSTPFPGLAAKLISNPH